VRYDINAIEMRTPETKRVHSPDGKERICLECLDKKRVLGKQLSGGMTNN